MDWLNRQARRVPTWVVYALGLVPLALLVWGAVSGGLGPDPVKAIERGLGRRGLQFLLASLAITPLRRVGLNLIRFRRALGLLSFVYIALHLTAWVWLDMGLRWTEMLADLTKRPFVIVGMIGFLVMVPLALTSNAASIRRLGAAAWGRLHQLAYVAIVAGVLHYVLLSKVWSVQILVYLVLAFGLLGVRLLPKLPRRQRVGA